VAKVGSVFRTSFSGNQQQGFEEVPLVIGQIA